MPIRPLLAVARPCAARQRREPGASARRLALALLAWLTLLQCLPLLSQAVAHQLATQQGSGVQICTASGMAWVVDSDSDSDSEQALQPQDQPASSAPQRPLAPPHTGPVCDWCAIHLPQPVLPSQMACGLPQHARTGQVPSAFSSDATLAAAPQLIPSPRGPPLRA